MFHSEILIWFLIYVLPVIAAYIFALFVPIKKWTTAWRRINTIAIHIAILISFALSQYVIYSSNLMFPWRLDSLSATLLVVSVFIAVLVIGRFGIIYSASAFIQEATMLSISYLLLQTLPVWLVILLVIPLFVFSHFLSLEKWKLRLFLLTLGGSASILLFSITLNIYLLTSLHILVGAFLISKSIIYSKSTWSLNLNKNT